MTQTVWGRWTLNTNTACLETVIAADTGATYQVPVDELSNSAKILDWVFQVEEKTWANSADVGDLVSAVREIIGRGVASSGKDNPLDPKKILSERYGCKFP